MKTVDDIRALIPTIVDEILGSDHNVGAYSKYLANEYYYEEDGWDIEVLYESTSDDDKEWGRVIDITGRYEDTELDGGELDELYEAINDALAR